MKQPSPFDQARQEHEGRRSYFLPVSFARVEKANPIYIVGTRGAGKTTFLRALTWSERAENPSLQRQLTDRDGELFAGHYVGVYMKLPKSQLYLFDRWLPNEHELYSDFLSLHLGLNWIQLIAEGMSELIARGIIEVDPRLEQSAVAAIVDQYESYSAFQRHVAGRETRTLTALARGLRELRRELERMAQRRRPLDEAIEAFPVERLAAFAQFSAAHLVRLLPADVEPPWSFRVCMDEGESMSHRQQVVMNSVVRTIEFPIVPVVAYVSLSAWPNATDSPLTVGKADVEDIPLDRMTDDEFKAFAQGVASVRVQDTLGDGDVDVDLDHTLGHLDLNALLWEIIKTSADPDGRALLERAEANRDKRYFAERQSSAPPIYQTYLVERLELEIPRQTDSQAARRQKSAEIRKRNVAAYLAICRELNNTTPLYATAAMVVQMSDGCVRDFLWQLHELFVERNVPVDKFLSKQMPYRDQHRALSRASEQKMGRIGGLILAEPRQAERLVDGLAQLTAQLQRPRRTLSRDLRHLRSPEPGWWWLPDLSDVPVDPLRADPSDLPVEYRLVVDAVEAGYLRLEPKAVHAWRFRVHTSLAAHYGFSYRGAQYEVQLEPGQIRQLCETSTEEDRRRLIRGIYDGLRGSDDDDLILFESADGP